MDQIKKKINFFGDKSSFHGIRHIFSRSHISWFERLFWLTILTVCSLGALVILRSSLSLYSEDAVSFSVETNYLDWDTPFPTLTICESPSTEHIKAYLVANKLPISLTNFYKEVVYWNAKYCKHCSFYKPNVTCVQDFEDQVRHMRLKCNQILTECWWDGKPFRCCDRFAAVETEYGVCYSFNSGLTGNNSSTIIVNRRVGLPTLVFTAIEAIWIRVHGPDDVVSVMMDNALGSSASLPLVTDVEVILKAEQTVSDVSVTALHPDVRGCLYQNERPAFADKWPFKKYSYSACVLYCRAMAQYELCNCTYHVMPKIGDIPVCGIQGLICLNKNKESLENPTCSCPMGCEEILYKLVHKFFVRHSASGELASRGTRGKVRLAQLPSLRVRRLAIRDTLGLVGYSRNLYQIIGHAAFDLYVAAIPVLCGPIGRPFYVQYVIYLFKDFKMLAIYKRYSI
ncbi:Sodium channel protein Nach [Papilio machaon]|uniref:Sodium channel protein Nach n=1 Tax=Papilio machaon TaxID=76193 RepID=A0A194R5V6_PAPMA|nr:Sodium channel protein Nach [Papilio machaon]